MLSQGNHSTTRPLADPLLESRRLVAAATLKGVTVRLLGGVAVFLHAPSGGSILPRTIGDIDLATRPGSRRATTEVMEAAGYESDEMFNALHGARRLLFFDGVNSRKLDVFIGDFTMCHTIPIADRLDRDPLTVPLAELMLTKLQIVEITERDQTDIYNLAFHNHVSDGDGTGIEADYIASLCSKDWGLWRTCKATIERSLANLHSYSLSADATLLITARLQAVWKGVEMAPKSARWRLRNRVGDRVQWYNEPEETAGAN